MTRVRYWGFRLSTVILSLTICGLLLEALSAIVYHYEKAAGEAIRQPPTIEGSFHNAGELEADSYVYYRSTPNQRHRFFETNRYGLRNGEISSLPAEGTLRILLLGGSVAWGYSAQSNQETISSYLEQELNRGLSERTGLRFEVLNAGVSGYVAWQESLSYALYHRKLGSQLILVLDGVNEFTAALTASRAGYPLGFHEETAAPRNRRPSLSGIFADWVKWKVQRLKFYKLFYDDEIPRLGITRLLRHFRPVPVSEIHPPPPSEVAATYRKALQHLVDVAGFDERMVLAVLQPLLLLPQSKRPTRFEENTRLEYEMKLPGAGAYNQEVYEKLREVLRSMPSANPNLQTLDASQLYRDDPEEIFVDDCHLTPLGRRKLARVLAERIAALPLSDLAGRGDR